MAAPGGTTLGSTRLFTGRKTQRQRRHVCSHLPIGLDVSDATAAIGRWPLPPTGLSAPVTTLVLRRPGNHRAVTFRENLSIFFIWSRPDESIWSRPDESIWSLSSGRMVATIQ